MNNEWQDVKYYDANGLAIWGARMVRVETIIFSNNFITIKYNDWHKIHHIVEIPRLKNHTLRIE